MRARTWPWFKARVRGLLTTPPAGYYVEAVDEKHERRVPVWRTRIQDALLTKGA